MLIKPPKNLSAVVSTEINKLCRLDVLFTTPMAEQAESSSGATFLIPQPLFRRIVGRGAIAVFSAVLLFGVVVSFKNIAGLSIVLISATAIVLFWWLALPTKNVSPRLEITPETIRYRPGRFERFMTEPQFVSALNSQTEEIVLCRSLFQELPDGFRIIVRSKDGTEREYRTDSLDYLSRRESAQLAAVLNTATGLPVRLVRRRRLTDGTTQESQWPVSPRGAGLRSIIFVGVGILPLVAGGIIGYIFPTTAMVLTAGFVLCLSQIILSVNKTRTTAQIAAGAATTFAISGGAYALAYVLIAHLMGHF